MTPQTKSDLIFIATNLLTAMTMVYMTARCFAAPIQLGSVTEFLLARGIPCIILALYVILMLALNAEEEQAARRRKEQPQ